MGTQILGFGYVPEINRPKCEMSSIGKGFPQYFCYIQKIINMTKI